MMKKYLLALSLILMIAPSAYAIGGSTPVKGLPDLISDSASTTLIVSGEVGVDASGSVVDFDVTYNATCGIKNTGTGIASGKSWSTCSFFRGDLELTSYGNLTLAPGGVVTFTGELVEKRPDPEDEPFYSLDSQFLLQGLYYQKVLSGYTYELDVSYHVDHGTLGALGIAESKEYNNKATETAIIDDSGITWVTR